MLHVTFADESTALFNDRENVIVTTWISNNGEYFDSPAEGPAELMLKTGWCVLCGESWDELKPLSIAKIIRIRQIAEHITN